MNVQAVSYVPYSEGGMDGGMFNPRNLDSMQQANLDFVRANTPNAIGKFKNLFNVNESQNCEVVYDQAYVDNLLMKINHLSTQLDIANKNILDGNSTIDRLDDLIDDLKFQLNQYQK